MIESRPLPSIFLTALLVVTMSGCDSFDNPLRWEESPIADDLVGAWTAVEGPNTGARARVWRTDGKTLGFEVTSPGEKERTTFLGNVLEAGSVHLLQVRLDSYKAFDEDGQSPEDPVTGFYFWRIVPAPENGVSVHELSPDTMGRVAERELAASGVEIEGDVFARCLSDNVRDRLWTKTWADLREKLDARVLAEVQEAVGLDRQEAEALERKTALLANLRVDPYAALEDMTECVAYRLPSESLEQLFLHHADLIFSGDVDRYVRE